MILNKTQKWSDRAKSTIEDTLTERPWATIKSKLCPLLWVSWVTCFVKSIYKVHVDRIWFIIHMDKLSKMMILLYVVWMTENNLKRSENRYVVWVVQSRVIVKCDASESANMNTKLPPFSLFPIEYEKLEWERHHLPVAPVAEGVLPGQKKSSYFNMV